MPLAIDRATHRYTKDGRVVRRSVTQVLKESRLIDFSAIPSLILERAMARGRAVHEAIQFYNEGDLDVVAFEREFPDYVPYFDGWRRFHRDRQFRSILCEQLVYHEGLDVAGTIDCLGVLDGRGVLLDFATGNPADCAKDLQTAAYYGLALEWKQHDPALADFFDEYKSVDRYGVALHSDGTFSLERYADPMDWRHFRALVEALKVVDARKPRIPERIPA